MLMQLVHKHFYVLDKQSQSFVQRYICNPHPVLIQTSDRPCYLLAVRWTIVRPDRRQKEVLRALRRHLTEVVIDRRQDRATPHAVDVGHRLLDISRRHPRRAQGLQKAQYFLETAVP